MDEYYTAKQLQELLKVDRITIYRMLQDGRLKGVKIGQQWRFPTREVEALLSGVHEPALSTERGNAADFPTHCVQAIQNVFAEVSRVGTVAVDSQGNPLTQVSHGCEFCHLIQSTPAGLSACQASLGSAVNGGAQAKSLFTCHAGLHYARARITAEGKTIAFLLSGQFYERRPQDQEEKQRINRLAEKYQLAPVQLARAAQEIMVLDDQARSMIQSWTEHTAEAINSILSERAGLVDRLQKIAEISSISSTSLSS